MRKSLPNECFVYVLAAHLRILLISREKPRDADRGVDHHVTRDPKRIFSFNGAFYYV